MSDQNENAPSGLPEVEDPSDDKPKNLKPRSLKRVVRKRPPKPARMIGYDYETTRIEAGTPRPLYITAFGTGLLHYASRIDSMAHLGNILVGNFLTDELIGCKFVAWNGNNFDAYFTAAALVTNPDYIMRPYLTRSKALRGLKVMRRSDFDIDGDEAIGWEFLDGIAMLGLVGVRLGKLLETFAPHLPKLEGAIDFEVETFDPDNPQHCAYAMRDSVGLEYAMNRAQEIMIAHFKQPLTVTMGGACIRILKTHIPDAPLLPYERDCGIQAQSVVIYPSKPELVTVIRQYAMRGGYCYCVRTYEGPVYKYDLNQAYASAMRETKLPCGSSFHTRKGINQFAEIYVARLTARKPGNTVPFYCRTFRGGRIVALFATEEIPDTWLCSNEVEQLRAEGWQLEISESWAWSQTFNLKAYVDLLESKRSTCEGGPAGPEGTIIKNVGNHSYGKTLEELEPKEYLISSECPPGFVPSYTGDDADPLEHIYERHTGPQRPKDYHQPQIGAFITAHVRMVVRRAALLSPATWLYADTDCTVFAADVSAGLDIDPKRYGAWKVEESGTRFQIIAKKVYTSIADERTRMDWDHADPDVKAAARKRVKSSAKGLHVRNVTPAQFDAWVAGAPPEQVQTQRNNFLRVLEGREMYRSQARKGTAVSEPIKRP